MEFEILVPTMEKETAIVILDYTKTVFPQNPDVKRIAMQIVDAKYWESYDSGAKNRQEYWRVVKNCLDVLPDPTAATATHPPKSDASVEQRAKEYADNVCPYEWPKNKEGEPVTAVPGQTGAPGSAKHRKLQNKIIAAFLAGHSSQQTGDAVTLTREQVVEFANRLIFSYENSGNPAGDLIPSSNEVIDSLFKQRGK